jgi:hypothetical protein
MGSMSTQQESKVVSNIRNASELERTIKAYLKDGWTLVSSYPVSGAGYIGVSFVAVFTK